MCHIVTNNLVVKFLLYSIVMTYNFEYMKKTYILRICSSCNNKSGENEL